MVYPKNTMIPVGAILLGLGLLLFSGCAKEELVAPGSTPTAVHKAGDAGAVDTMEGGNHGGIIPISDDGDDLGDRERSNRPKNR